MMTFLKRTVPLFFLASLAVLACASVYRMMAEDLEAFDADWMTLERQYLDRIDAVLRAEDMAATASGFAVSDLDFAKRARYELRFESDKTLKIGAINAFEREAQEFFDALVARDPQAAGRYFLLVSLTEAPTEKARMAYNESVRTYNTKLSLFPRNRFASLFGHRKQALLSMQTARPPL